MHSGDKHHFFLCQVFGCSGWRQSQCLFPFTPGVFGGSEGPFCTGKHHFTGTWLCRDERLPAGKVHYFVTLHFHCDVAFVWIAFFSFFFFQKNFQDKPKNLAVILSECLKEENKILGSVSEAQVRWPEALSWPVKSVMLCFCLWFTPPCVL